MHIHIHQQSSNGSSNGVLPLIYVRVMLLAVLLCHCVYCLLYVHEYGLLLWSLHHEYLYMTIGHFFPWHASLRHPAGTTPLPEGYMYQMYFFCTSATSSLSAAGLFSRSRLRGTQGGRVYTTSQVWSPVGLRGACSGRSESRLAGYFSRARFQSQTGPWKSQTDFFHFVTSFAVFEVIFE